ncbi:hypothetical protein PAMC26577_14250 [Caballeronia sordidicola]|uniref:Uncharacterized protein n=1 Tax=Caballeronia sordidicola TaxID=196367 RepID=A0A242MUB3_CABSO|nr:hypothetical protein PAMC26577_14250 [Caballeronia sordidicola]
MRVRTFIDFMIERVADNTRFFLDTSDLRAACAQISSPRIRSQTFALNFCTWKGIR